MITNSNLEDAEILKDDIEEFNNLMQAGYDEIAVGETETAEEYFSDACYVLDRIQNVNTDIAKELENKYSINPRNYAV